MTLNNQNSFKKNLGTPIFWTLRSFILKRKKGSSALSNLVFWPSSIHETQSVANVSHGKYWTALPFPTRVLIGWNKQRWFLLLRNIYGSIIWLGARLLSSRKVTWSHQGKIAQWIAALTLSLWRIFNSHKEESKCTVEKFYVLKTDLILTSDPTP